MAVLSSLAGVLTNGMSFKEVLFAIGAVIDEQPTVFDVDKVVEQLVIKLCHTQLCRFEDHGSSLLYC